VIKNKKRTTKQQRREQDGEGEEGGTLEGPGGGKPNQYSVKKIDEKEKEKQGDGGGGCEGIQRKPIFRG